MFKRIRESITKINFTMTKFIVIICALALPICTFSQSSKINAPVKTASGTKSNSNFEQYCLKNATSLIQNTGDKTVKFSGTIQKIKNSDVPSYTECGIVLKENESQYFKIEGSNQILAVKSLFILRLNHKNSKI